MKRIKTLLQYKRELHRLHPREYQIGSRNCSCGSHGITPKGIMASKIWQCDQHGFICPFDNWQFKTIDELAKHLDDQVQFHWAEKSYRCCEGIFRYGVGAVEEAKFEIFVYRLEQKVGKNVFYEVYFGYKPEPSLEGLRDST